MQQPNYTKVNCVLLLSALVFLALSCKVTDAGATADDTTDGGGTTPPVTHTITIKANGGTMGSLTQIPNIADGATVPAPTTGLPTLTDNEIAYWSTDADKYNTVFEFDKSKVYSDLTIYPHYRLTLAAVSKLMEGNWLSTYVANDGTTSNSKYLFRINSSKSTVVRCEISNQFNSSADLSDSSNVDNLSAMKIMPTDTSLSIGTHNVGGKDYTIFGSSNSYWIVPGTSTAAFDLPQCNYSNDLLYSLNSYIATNSNDIQMDKFGALNALTLKSYSISQLVLTITSGQLAGTYTLTKSP